MLVHLFILKKFFSLSLPDAKHNIWFFLCPPTDLNVVCFSSKGPLYCPQMVNFLRSVEKCWCHFDQGFYKFGQCSSCLTILFWNQLSYFKDHVYSTSSCWNEIIEMSVFESNFFFWNSSFFGQRPNTRYSMQFFDCFVFWKHKWPVVRLKWFLFFFMVLCVSFNLWSWVYLLMVCDEVTFCEFQENKRLKSNLRIHQVRLFSFLAPILLVCIITSSLIHKATTLMESSSSFEIAIYRFRLLTWLKRAF